MLKDFEIPSGAYCLEQIAQELKKKSKQTIESTEKALKEAAEALKKTEEAVKKIIVIIGESK